MNTRTWSAKVSAIRFGSLGLVALWIVAGGFSAGCGSSDSGPGDPGVVSPTTSTTGDAAANLGFTAPSIDDLRERLGLTDEQATALGKALDDFQAALSERRAAHGNRPGGPPQGDAPRGPRGGNGSQGPLGGLQGSLDSAAEPPVAAFLETAAGILDGDQLVGLAGYLVERRDEARTARQQVRAGNRQGMGPGFRGSHGPGPGGDLDQLGLTDEQKQAVQQARDEMRQAMQDLLARRDELSRAELQTLAKQIRDTFDARLKDILDADQYARLEELRQERQNQREERRNERIQQQLDNLDQHTERLAAFLTNVLHLTDAQIPQIRDILDGAAAERRTLLQWVLDGSVTADQLREESQRIMEATGDAIRAVLTPEQQAVFDALRDLLPGYGLRHRG